MPDTWHITINGKKVGPLTLQELKATLATFANANDVLVCCDRLVDWKPAREFSELTWQTAPSLLLPPVHNAAQKPMGSSPTDLSNIRPVASPSLEKLNRRHPQLITIGHVVSAIAILAIVIFAFTMSKRGEPGVDRRQGPEWINGNG